jgi:hypothetical protein
MIENFKNGWNRFIAILAFIIYSSKISFSVQNKICKFKFSRESFQIFRKKICLNFRHDEENAQTTLSLLYLIYTFFCLSVSLSLCHSFLDSFCLSVFLSICHSFLGSFCLSASLSFYLTISLSCYLSVFLSLSLFI